MFLGFGGSYQDGMSSGLLLLLMLAVSYIRRKIGREYVYNNII